MNLFLCNYDFATRNSHKILLVGTYDCSLKGEQIIEKNFADYAIVFVYTQYFLKTMEKEEKELWTRSEYMNMCCC